MDQTRLLRAYYLATLVFLALDLVFGLNVRIAFFEGATTLKALYYAVCFGCAGLVLWKPAIAVVVGTFESLFSLVALILNMGIRTLGGTMALAEGGVDFVTFPELANFLIVGMVGYYSWQHGMRQLFGDRHY